MHATATNIHCSFCYSIKPVGIEARDRAAAICTDCISLAVTTTLSDRARAHAEVRDQAAAEQLRKARDELQFANDRAAAADRKVRQLQAEIDGLRTSSAQDHA